MVYIVHFTL